MGAALPRLQTGRVATRRSDPARAPVTDGQTPSPRAKVSAKLTAALFSLNEAIVLPESVDTRHVLAGPGPTRYTVPSLCVRFLISRALARGAEQEARPMLGHADCWASG